MPSVLTTIEFDMPNDKPEVRPAPKRDFPIIKPSNLNYEIEPTEEEFDFLAPLWKLFTFLGFKSDTISREEAARLILERPIRIIYRPTIVEIDQPSRTYE